MNNGKLLFKPIFLYSLFIIQNTDYQAGFLKLTKHALVYYLILAITIPSIFLYSLFIIPKSAEAAWPALSKPVVSVLVVSVLVVSVVEPVEPVEGFNDNWGLI